MRRRYYFEITDGPKPYYVFSYFDTEELLAQPLFSHLGVHAEYEGVYGDEEAPYRFAVVRIPRQERELFMHALDLLPDWMIYSGHTDYDDFCYAMMRDASEWMARRRGEHITPLQ